MEDPKKKPVALGMPRFFERFPDDASARSFIEKRLWEDKRKEWISGKNGKPTCPGCSNPRYLEEPQRVLSMPRLPESPFGEIRHCLRKKQDSL